MGSHLDYAESLHSLVDLMVPAAADVCFFDEVAENGAVRRRAWKHTDASRDEWLGANAMAGVIQSSEDVPARRLREGKPEFIPRRDRCVDQRRINLAGARTVSPRAEASLADADPPFAKIIVSSAS